MDPSVLCFLGPDFDKQTVLTLLGDNHFAEPNFLQPTTPTTWCNSNQSPWSSITMHEPPVYTPRSVMSELGPQSPTSGATKRPFSDVSNRTTGLMTTSKLDRFFFLNESCLLSISFVQQLCSSNTTRISDSKSINDTGFSQTGYVVDQTIANNTRFDIWNKL